MAFAKTTINSVTTSLNRETGLVEVDFNGAAPITGAAVESNPLTGYPRDRRSFSYTGYALARNPSKVLARKALLSGRVQKKNPDEYYPKGSVILFI